MRLKGNLLQLRNPKNDTDSFSTWTLQIIYDSLHQQKKWSVYKAFIALENLQF